ncbi:DUF4435 domain-containing protein [Pseudomonas lundensis]|uniref:DUF4435 domain-containing protein n=1 Tax=Pseudomonas lundensis TaxID=86185 RepID=UPI00193BB318|nr:DUF4435 domain-containing protein [Pseudomonas lundensis]MBM1181829.1 DUF4435 domain-containing protein [Pseudomonas lundensis]
MELKYDLPKYITMTKMSGKIRVLVEGKDDRGHVLNLLSAICPSVKFKVDTALEIRGDCNKTKNNNRAKIEKIHDHCKAKTSHRRLFFLCDREFRNFDVAAVVTDQAKQHEFDGNLTWTLGHSIENYFLNVSMLAEGFRYLSNSGYKTDAVKVFREILGDSLRIIAALTLAARELGCAKYPPSIAPWQSFEISTGEVGRLVLKGARGVDSFQDKFWGVYDKFYTVASSTSEEVCARLCRGHTAVIILQRVFAACLYNAGLADDEVSSRHDANVFNNIGEANISSALSEAWIKHVEAGCLDYPLPLVESIYTASA